jgi:hypothetical protein
MTGLFWASYLLQWVLLAVLTLLVLLLYRQYGRSVLPAKDRLRLAGLDIGKAVPGLTVTGRDGVASRIQFSSDGTLAPAARLLMCGSSACPICSRLWHEVNALPSERPDVEFLWIQSGSPEDDAPPDGWRVISDIRGSAHEALEVPALPYAYVLDSAGIVRSKGLMNDLDDFRALLAEAAGEPVTHPPVRQLT